MARSCVRTVDVLKHGCAELEPRFNVIKQSLTSYGLTTWLLRFGVGPNTVKELADLGG